MANKKISQLTRATSLSSSDLSLVVNGGLTKSVPLSTLKQFINTGDPALSSSNNWDNAFASVNSLSGNWNNSYSTTFSLSSGWSNVYTTVNSTSADWNSSYTSVKETSGNWNSAYVTATAVNTTVASNSANWGSVFTTVQANSGSWNPRVGQQTVYISTPSSVGITSITGNIIIVYTHESLTEHSSTPLLNIPDPSKDGEILYVGNKLSFNTSLTLQITNNTFPITPNQIVTLYGVISGDPTQGKYRWFVSGYPTA